MAVEDSDASIELQDSIYEMCSPSTAARSMAFANDELRARLPLAYDLNPASCGDEATTQSTTTQPTKTRTIKLSRSAENEWRETVFISQVTKWQSAQADVGFVMWPSRCRTG